MFSKTIAEAKYLRAAKALYEGFDGYLAAYFVQNLGLTPDDADLTVESLIDGYLNELFKDVEGR